MTSTICEGESAADESKEKEGYEKKDMRRRI
jgi:hypothetical protein